MIRDLACRLSSFCILWQYSLSGRLLLSWGEIFVRNEMQCISYTFVSWKRIHVKVQVAVKLGSQIVGIVILGILSLTAGTVLEAYEGPEVDEARRIGHWYRIIGYILESMALVLALAYHFW